MRVESTWLKFVSRLHPAMRLGIPFGLYVAALPVGLPREITGSDWAGLTLFIMAFPFSIYLTSRLTEFFSHRKATLSGILYAAYVCVLFLPAPYAFLSFPGGARWRFAAAMIWGAWSMPVVFWVISRWMKHDLDESTPEPYPNEPSVRWTTLAFGSMIIVGTAFAFTIGQGAPLIGLIQDPGADIQRLAEYRQTVRFQGNLWAGLPLELLRFWICPLGVALAFGYWFEKKSCLRSLGFLFVLIGALLYGASGLRKAPISHVVAAILFTGYLISQGRMKKWMTPLAGGVVAFPVLMYGVLGLNPATRLVYRLLIDPSQSLLYYFQFFPDTHDFLYGTSSREWCLVTGQERFNASEYVYQQMGGRSDGGFLYPDMGTWPMVPGGSMPSAFMGSFYADFGIFGVVVGSILVFALFRWMEILISRRTQTPLTRAVLAYSGTLAVFLTLSPFAGIFFLSLLMTLVVVAIGTRRRYSSRQPSVP